MYEGRPDIHVVATMVGRCVRVAVPRGGSNGGIGGGTNPSRAIMVGIAGAAITIVIGGDTVIGVI